MRCALPDALRAALRRTTRRRRLSLGSNARHRAEGRAAHARPGTGLSPAFPYMVKEIIVNARRDSTRIALVEDGQLAEFHIETPDHERTIGNLYLGRVKKVMPNIRAAFVDIGERQDAFLHFSDLTDNLPLLLSFLDQDAPEVGRQRIRVEARLARKKRRFAKPRRTGMAESGVEARRTAIGHLLENRHPQRRRRRAEPSVKRAALPTLPKQRTLDGYLQNNQRILVKIIKEPISHKGSRVSTDISLAGRFLVLVPLADYVAVSKKISSFRERKRLRALVRSLTPEGFGVIVRTQAEGQTARALDTDLRLLVEKWRKIERHLQGRPQHPKTVYEDVNMVSSVVRDLFSEDFKRILVDEPRLFKNLKGYVQAVAPSLADCVKYHDNSKPVFEAVGIEHQLRLAFDTRVPMPSGGYLIIERTEAMHVVDVNSGRAGKGLSQEENALRVDLEAARMVCRHLRLRDLGGIICVDFIDLRDEKNRRKVLEEIKKEFKKDRAVTKVLPMSDFGIVQITRQRLRPSFTTWAGEGDDARRDESVPAMAERRRDEERRNADRRETDRYRDGREPVRREERPERTAAPSVGAKTDPETTGEADAANPSATTSSGADDAPKKRRRRGGRGRRRDELEAEPTVLHPDAATAVDPTAEALAEGEPPLEAAVHATPEAEDLAEALEAAAEGAPKKKRRRRGGRGRGRRTEQAEAESVEEAAEIEEAEVEAETANGASEAEIVETETVVVVEAAAVEAKPKRTRTPKTTPADADASKAEAKPKRTRAKKTAEESDGAPGEAAEAKPKRSRAKKAEPSDAEAEPLGAEIKPKRTRAKKADASDT